MTRSLFAAFLIICVISLSLAQAKYERAEKLCEEAQAAYRSGNYELAGRKIDESLQIVQSADAYYLSGLIFEAMGKDLRAVSAYEATLQLDPEYREAIFQKGLIYLNYGDPSQALEDFSYLITNIHDISETRAIYFQVDPLGASQNQLMTMITLEARLYNYRGQSHDKLGDYAAAMQDYNEAIRRDSIADYFVSRALLHAKTKKEELAMHDLRTAISLEPENQLAWYNLTLLNPSVDLPDHLVTNSEFAPTLGLLASRAMEEGRYEEAMKYFDQSLKNNPDDALVHINRGRVLLKMERYAAAREDFNTAKKLEPTRIEALYLIGNSWFFQQNYTNAVAFYNQYLTVDPTNAMVWYNAAMVYLEQDKHEDACHYLKKALTLGMNTARSLTAKYCE